MKKNNLLKCTCVFLILTSLSCSKNQNNNLHYKVVKQDFINQITTFGTVEEQQLVLIICPEIRPNPQINSLVPEGSYVHKDDIVCTLKADAIKIDYDNALKELETTKAELSKTQAELQLNKNLLEAELRAVKASLAIANLQLPQLEFLPPNRQKIIQLELKRANIEKSKIQKKLSSLDVVHSLEINRILAKITRAENKVQRCREFIDKLILRSPIDGLVIYEINWNTGKKNKEGDNVWEGQPILKIPKIDKLQVNVKVKETYIKRIAKNQRAFIHLDARPDLPLTGKVTSIANMGKPITRNSPVKAFEVIVELDSTRERIQIGLNATCHILVNERPDAIAVPKECIFEQDSLKVAYVKSGSKYESRKLNIGPSSDDFTLVKQGLSGGEQLALLKPPKNLIQPLRE